MDQQNRTLKFPNRYFLWVSNSRANTCIELGLAIAALISVGLGLNSVGLGRISVVGGAPEGGKRHSIVILPPHFEKTASALA